MATNRAMLKEAIADAKAVKETAIANAKAALEEAFTPQLKSMLSMKLQEMESDEDDLEETYISEKKDEDLEEMYGKKDDKNMMEVDLEELLAELEEDEMEEGLYEAEETEEETEETEETEKETEDEGEPIDLEDMTDEDLKSMIEDVIADMIKSGELEAGSESEEAEMDIDMEMEPEDEEVDLAELLKEIEEMEEEEKMVNEVDSELTDADFKDIDSLYQKTKMVAESDQLNEGDASALSLVIGFLSFAGVVFGVLKAQAYAKKKANDPTDPDHEYWKKALENMKEVGKAAGSSGASGGDVFEETYSSRELKEAYSTIKTLKSELNEINLLNAKLLYTNKIFKSKTLNENQKVKVLSSFDKAKNVGEVKMVFETLNEGIKVSKNTINENLGRASKGTMAPNVKKPIVESNEAFLRMQKLAGII
jgi:hypothetical protein